LNNNHDVWGLVSQAAEPVEEEPTDNGNTDNGAVEEELADTGADSVALWFGFALALALMALGGFAIRRSTRS
jgi:LPXTG-motif cell wall-anchored protein